MQSGLWVLIVMVVSLLLSKILKLFFFKDPKDAMLAGGGMPSSHCASAMSLTSMIFLFEGFTTTFTLSLAFASIVFIDAIRVRRAVGINAATLKKIAKRKDPIMIENGHTLPEAVYGCVLGLVVAISTYLFFIM
jgi:acid phosphatase family membrane protein YuiD